MARFWMSDEEDESVYRFRLLDGREVMGQVKSRTWQYSGRLYVFVIFEGASTLETFIPFSSVVSFEKVA